MKLLNVSDYKAAPRGSKHESEIIGSEREKKTLLIVIEGGSRRMFNKHKKFPMKTAEHNGAPAFASPHRHEKVSHCACVAL